HFPPPPSQLLHPTTTTPQIPDFIDETVFLNRSVFVISIVLVSARMLSVNPPRLPASDSLANITWTSTSSDPCVTLTSPVPADSPNSIFSVELTHPSFNAALTIANNVNPKANNLTLTIPSALSGAGYTLQFVNATDIN
ncbi:hypothetical protein C8R44DRAFT_902790, partial [Mycena epipterygia]